MLGVLRFYYTTMLEIEKSHEKCRQIAGDFNCHVDAAVLGMTRGASPDEAHPGHHLKQLDAAIKQVPAPYHPGGRHDGQRICSNNTKHYQNTTFSYHLRYKLITICL